MVNKIHHFDISIMCYSFSELSYYYCVSSDAVGIVKLCICVAVGKPILIVQPMSVGPASRD